MSVNSDKFQKSYDRWVRNERDLAIYFNDLIEMILNTLHEYNSAHIKKEIEEGKYKALFVPVGYSFENVALISAYVKPKVLSLAFSEMTLRFHRRRNLETFKEKIKKYCPDIKMPTLEPIKSDDQKDMESAVLAWIDDMKRSYGFSDEQLAIDLSGGTKPMAIGAQNAASAVQRVDAFYLKVDYEETISQRPKLGTERLIKLVKANPLLDPKLVFVIMPFARKYDELYKWLRETVEAASLKCLRADEDIFTGGIMDQVRLNIQKAENIIAILTGGNLNVYYELGMAHAFGKNVIMMAEDAEKLPFDVRHLNGFVYSLADKKDFQENLQKRIENLKVS